MWNRAHEDHWRDLSWSFPKTLDVLKMSAEDEIGDLTHRLDSMVEGIVLLIGGKGNSAVSFLSYKSCTIPILMLIVDVLGAGSSSNVLFIPEHNQSN